MYSLSTVTMTRSSQQIFQRYSVILKSKEVTDIGADEGFMEDTREDGSRIFRCDQCSAMGKSKMKMMTCIRN